ncbi:hypothetical protein ENSA5_67330 [Enhygromyxa salina]|uniref:Uncharacterized protein n=2 Tax=Enhygromyxa salina TaxID=215803 RepID=A0A2S9XC02_9BACT|nr:hypothetical protein ENSA5_67330 [Enhygromyxa salina]
MGDTDCQDMCLAEASPEALAESSALVQCIGDNACLDEVCIDENCYPEAFACNHGDDTCLELTTCVDLCGGDEPCEAACNYEATPLALAQVAELEACALDNACNDDACLTEFCANEYVSCVGGGSDGLSCPPLVDCLIGCGYDQDCALDCAPPLTPNAQLEAEALGACAEFAMCDTFACTEELCAGEWGVCVSGEADCAKIYECTEACEGAVLCETNCLHNGAFDQQFVFFDLNGCIANHACEDQACIDQNCGEQALACGV